MEKLTLIKRSEPVCPHCVTMQLKLEEAGILFNTIDITDEPEAVEKYGLSSVPVILIDSDGKQIKLNGIQPIELIEEFLED